MSWKDGLSKIYRDELALYEEQGYEIEHSHDGVHTLVIKKDDEIVGRVQRMFLAHAVGAIGLCLVEYHLEEEHAYV